MKRLCFIFLCLSSAYSYAQINGKYCNYTGYESTEITFEDGKYFCYWSSSCVDYVEGTGTYTILDNLLTLTFRVDNSKKIKKNKEKPDPFVVVINDGHTKLFSIGKIEDDYICMRGARSSLGFNLFLKEKIEGQFEKADLDDFLNNNTCD